MYAKVKAIFRAWKRTDFAGDLFEPAKNQFDGAGSFGNGGGMRIAAVPMFYANAQKAMI